MFWIMALLGNWEPTHFEKHCERDDIANEDDNEDEDEEDDDDDDDDDEGYF